MGDNSAIQWTDATWNPGTGCSKVSPGCRNCYAERLSARLHRMGNPKYKQGFKFLTHEAALSIPVQWSKPRKIFVDSMSDLFHESMPEDFLIRCFEIMSKADWHIYQILTKRPERMLSFIRKYGKISNHIWLGTSVELSVHKNRIDLLRKVQSQTRFVSFEPLLGPIGELNLAGISWVIVGGESGPHHRPIKAEWIREIKRQCITKKVAFFFKQWGGLTPKSNGRDLDGKEWNEFPCFYLLQGIHI